METAITFCQRLVDWPRASLITSSRRHWDIFVGLCRDIKGPLVADAYIAALAIEHGCELVTADGDFARSSGLRWRHRSRLPDPDSGLFRRACVGEGPRSTRTQCAASTARPS